MTGAEKGVQCSVEATATASVHQWKSDLTFETGQCQEELQGGRTAAALEGGGQGLEDCRPHSLPEGRRATSSFLACATDWKVSSQSGDAVCPEWVNQDLHLAAGARFGGCACVCALCPRSLCSLVPEFAAGD